MMFDFSDLADSIGVATGWRALAQSGQERQCSCQCGREEGHQRPAYLRERDPDEVFGTDELTAPPVIGRDPASPRA